MGHSWTIQSNDWIVEVRYPGGEWVVYDGPFYDLDSAIESRAVANRTTERLGVRREAQIVARDITTRKRVVD